MLRVKDVLAPPLLVLKLDLGNPVAWLLLLPVLFGSALKLKLPENTCVWLTSGV